MSIRGFLFRGVERTVRTLPHLGWGWIRPLVGGAARWSNATAPAFLAVGNKLTAASIVAGDRRLAHVTLDAVASPYPFALMIPRGETERLPDEHFNRHGNILGR